VTEPERAASSSARFFGFRASPRMPLTGRGKMAHPRIAWPVHPRGNRMCSGSTAASGAGGPGKGRREGTVRGFLPQGRCG